MSGREHAMVDAWVFVAIADAFSESKNPLTNVVASADVYNHDIPSAREFEHAVRDLLGAGLLDVTGMSFSLSARGDMAWREIAREPLMHKRIEFAQRAMEQTPCVAGDSGWSIDEQIWEEAIRNYLRPRGASSS